MAFGEVPRVDFVPDPQIPLEPPEPTPDEMAASAAAIDGDAPLAAAPMLIEDYGKTIEFAKFLTGIVDDRIKDVVVEVDPENDPEVWMAMKQIFGDTANPALSGRAYCQVLDLQRKCVEIEVAEADEASAIEDDFIRRFQEKAANG